jgi:DNA-binding MarR family transcriptional regulator
MIQGHLDSTFVTEQRDLFASGIVAEIGVNAYAVWSAIKYFADYNTGHAWPGMRKLGEKLGLSAMTVKRAIDQLEAAHMVRIVAGSTKRKGQTYLARERMAIRLGKRVLCTIVLDYIPGTLRQQINRIQSALGTGEDDPEAFADVEIIPGEGFAWDEGTRTLRARIPTRDIPRAPDPDDYHRQLGEQIFARIALKK